MRAWREPMVWLMLAIPLATIAGGIATIRLVAGPLDAAPEPVQRRAQIQSTDLAPDLRARTLGLQVTLTRIGERQWQWSTWPIVDGAAPVLTVLHPNRADLDLRFETGGPNRTIDFDPGNLPLDLCEFRLEDTNQGWRLIGRWDPVASRVAFRSTLAEP